MERSVPTAALVTARLAVGAVFALAPSHALHRRLGDAAGTAGPGGPARRLRGGRRITAVAGPVLLAAASAVLAARNPPIPDRTE